MSLKGTDEFFILHASNVNRFEIKLSNIIIQNYLTSLSNIHRQDIQYLFRILDGIFYIF